MPKDNAAKKLGPCNCAAFLFRRSRPSSQQSRPLRQEDGGVAEDIRLEFDVAGVREQVQGMVALEMRSLEESLGLELQGALERLRKADGLSSDGLAMSHTASSPSHFHTSDDADLPRHSRNDGRRRWTCAADGADSLVRILRRAASDAAAAQPQGARSGEASSASAEPQDAVSSLQVPRHRLKKMVSFDSQERSSEMLPELPEDSSPEAPDVELYTSEDRTATNGSGSSVGWRIDALDCGDRLAASAAAKKGSASVDSIIELVQSERERWEEEKLALEARLEEIKEQRRRFRVSPDAEKEALVRQVQQLRETMKQRSRFGAWVCERHMQESDDEEVAPRCLEKEELRETMATLEAELRDARAKTS